MTKGLENLEIIKSIQTNNYDRRINDYTSVNEECEYEISIIEKKLKALEIIKKKAVNVNTLINSIIGALNPLEFYNEKVSENLKLTKQEYELLKEMLEE